MALPFENPQFTPPHRLTQPSNIINRNPRVPRAVVDDYSAVDIDIAESYGLAPFEADKQIDGWVGIGRG